MGRLAQQCSRRASPMTTTPFVHIHCYWAGRRRRIAGEVRDNLARGPEPVGLAGLYDFRLDLVRQGVGARVRGAATILNRGRVQAVVSAKPLVGRLAADAVTLAQPGDAEVSARCGDHELGSLLHGFHSSPGHGVSTSYAMSGPRRVSPMSPVCTLGWRRPCRHPHVPAVGFPRACRAGRKSAAHAPKAPGMVENPDAFSAYH
jgi:hypothetical protein